MPDTFVFYKSYYEAMKQLPEEQALQLFCILCDYVFEGKLPQETGLCQMAFLLMKPTVDAACKRHEQAKAAGRARWDRKPSIPKETISEGNSKTPDKTAILKPVAATASAGHSLAAKQQITMQKANGSEATGKNTASPKNADNIPKQSALAEHSREEPKDTVAPPTVGRYGKARNIALTTEEFEQLKKTVPRLTDLLIEYGNYKLLRGLTNLWDYDALLYYAQHRRIPDDLFQRPEGQFRPPGSPLPPLPADIPNIEPPN